MCPTFLDVPGTARAPPGDDAGRVGGMGRRGGSPPSEDRTCRPGRRPSSTCRPGPAPAWPMTTTLPPAARDRVRRRLGRRSGHGLVLGADRGSRAAPSTRRRAWGAGCRRGRGATGRSTSRGAAPATTRDPSPTTCRAGTPPVSGTSGRMPRPPLAAWPDAAGGPAPRGPPRSPRRAMRRCPPEHAHRRDRKIAQLGILIREAAGVEASARLDADLLRPGEDAARSPSRSPPRSPTSRRSPSSPPAGRSTRGVCASPMTPRRPTPYPGDWLPDAPRAPALEVRVRAHGVEARLPPTLRGARPSSCRPAPPGSIPPPPSSPAGRDEARVELTAAEVAPQGGRGGDRPAARDGPRTGSSCAPRPPGPGLRDVPMTVGDERARAVTPRAGGPCRSRAPSTRPPSCACGWPRSRCRGVRIGCVAGGADRVGHWLRAMGSDARELDDAALDDLSPYGAIVVGVFALRTRPRPARGDAAGAGLDARGAARSSRSITARGTPGTRPAWGSRSASPRCAGG